MRKASDYRDRAEECRRLAKRATSAEEREALLKMAENWDSLADSRVEHAEQRERLARLDNGTRNQAGIEG